MKRRDLTLGLGVAASLAGWSGAYAGQMPSTGPDWVMSPANGDLAPADEAWRTASAPTSSLGRTDALVIVQGGNLIFERYGAGHGPTTRHVSWSMAKSFTHALIGIAVAQGVVNIDRPLMTVKNPDPGLNLRRLLNLTDGLKWDEGSYTPVDSDAARMLYGPGRLDGAAYLAARPQAYRPGAHWNYSTGAFQLAAAELQAHLFPRAKTPEARRASMAAWIRTQLFQPLGMASAIAEFDPAGTFYGGSLVYASARDFARFGELYRMDGVWGGRRLLPEGWVKFARTPTVDPLYGAGFWLETKPGREPRSLLGGRGPLDAFAAEGHDGQVILIAPSKALVVVRLGLSSDDPDAWAKLGDWLTPIVNAAPSVA